MHVPVLSATCLPPLCCLSSPGPAMPLGGSQVCAWDTVSLAGSTSLCTLVLSPVSPVPAWSAQLQNGLLAGGLACSLHAAGAPAIFLCSAASGLLNFRRAAGWAGSRQQAAGSRQQTAGAEHQWKPLGHESSH